MDSMEIDFDLDGDPIEEFLRHKLAEIKSARASLEDDLKTRSNLLKLSERRVAERGALKIKDVWKRTYHSKCVFGIVIENSSSGNFEFAEVVLNWDSPTPLTYSVRLYSKNELDEWASTDAIRASASVLIVLEKAPFLKRAVLNLEGFIKYVGEARVYQLQLPSLRVSAGDFIDRALEIHRLKLLRGADEEFLSYLVVNDVSEFVGKIIGNGRRRFESLLEIDCMLKQLDVKARRKYFLVDGISCSVDGCLLEVNDRGEDEIFHFNVLSRNQEQLKHLLHYLHRSVEGFSILPKPYEVHLRTSASQSFTKDGQEEDKTCKDFRRMLLQEVNCIDDFFADETESEDFFTDETKSEEKYAKFRNALSGLENQTDVLRAMYDV